MNRALSPTQKLKSWSPTFSINYFINIFILTIYFVVQMLIKEPVKLSIGPLTNINFFSMIHTNKKERHDEILTRLGCEQNQGDIFYNYFIYIFSL